MFNRCPHEWKEVKREFVRGPLAGRKFDFRGLGITEALELTTGYVAIELQCIHCGDVGSRRLAGHQN